MGKLTVKYVSPLGEYDQKFGQRYYGKAHDTDMDISFNLMNPVNFEDGDEIEFEEKVIKEKGPQSKNPGEEYLFLKKVKRANSGPQEAGGRESSSSSVAQAKPSPASAAAPELSYEAGTNARWSLKLAVDTYKSVVGGMPDSKQDYEQITKFARWLLSAYTDLKSAKPEVEEPAPNASDGSGLAKARAKADEIRGRTAEVEDVTDNPDYEDPFEGLDEEAHQG
jgi:hypothetical protein